MNHKPRDLQVITGITLLGAIITLLGVPWVGVRVLVMLPFVLFVPGYALTKAVFPPHTLGAVEQVLLSCGLSLAVSIVGGLALHWTPWGLQPATWTVLLASVTLGSCAIALRRRSRPAVRRAAAAARLTIQQGVLFGAAALLLGGAVVVAITGVRQQPQVGFAQLWLLPINENDSETVRLGVSNQEATATTYRLELRVAGQPAQTWQQIELAPHATWETNIALPTPGPVEAILYRGADSSAIYRRVELLRDAQAAAPPSTAEVRP